MILMTGAATPLDLVGGGIHCKEKVFSTGAFNRFDCKFSIFCLSMMWCCQVVLPGYVLEDNFLFKFLEYLRTLLTCDGNERADQGEDGLLGSSPRVLMYKFICYTNLSL